IEKGFPLEHIRDTEILSKRAIKILNQGPKKDRFKISSFKGKIDQFENPNKICFDFVREKLKKM
ncbi:MAG: hypothetical protein ACFFE5_15535, partial [Candidatus Thorarchaeota archaeon]